MIYVYNGTNVLLNGQNKTSSGMTQWNPDKMHEK